MMVDPWPEHWSDDWYVTDDVYVGYDNGYYLYNRRDPSVGLQLASCSSNERRRESNVNPPLGKPIVRPKSSSRSFPRANRAL